MKPAVYVETTIPSYYCDDRPGVAAEIRRTREWWDKEREAYECFISPVVVDELRTGHYQSQRACLALIERLPLLAVTTEVVEIAEVYQVHRLMPKRPAADAIHVALASYYRMDYLLTWNCRHIANANKARHLERINARLHLACPALVTPHLLQPWEQTDGQ